MHKLLIRFLGFLALPAAVFAFPAWALWVSGEWIPVETVLKRHLDAKHPVLIGQGYSYPWGYLKLRAVQELKPKITALGTSRVMLFRPDFFGKSFYNASAGVRRFDDIAKFIGRLKR